VVEVVLPVVEAVDPSAVEGVLLAEEVLPVVEVADPSALAWQLRPHLEETGVSKATCPPSSKETEARAISS
jgi:uncharacterized iron-regulated membrane protein